MDLSRYLELFVQESREHLSAAYALASVAEQAQAAPVDDAIRDIFRHVHSVKGMAASMGFPAMSALAHDTESLMDRLRDHRIAAPPSTTRLLMASLSCLERMAERAGRNDDVDDGERVSIQAGLREILAAGGETEAPVPLVRRRTAETVSHVNVAVIVRRDRSFPAVRAAIVLGHLGKLGRIVRTEPPMAALRTGRFDGRLLVTLRIGEEARTIAGKIAAIDEIETFTLVPVEIDEPRVDLRPPSPSLRIPATRIDALLEDVLELMSSLGRIEARGGGTPGSPDAREGETARRLARGLYDALVELRLVPFETVTQRLVRAVDELEHRLGKNVVLEVQGQEVRIDRSLLEQITDPLLHMVRNAVDHGIEPQAVREKARKPAAGRLAVRLVREAARVTLVVEDDGAGLDPRRLKQAAIERGLLTPGEAVRMDDARALEMITLPGFTTAERTTEISGRGVGMDVVKSTVEALGGTLRISSAPGRGTRFEVTLPSSVALVQAYLVRAGGAVFAVPLASIARMAPMDDQSTAWRDGRRFWSVGASDVPVRSLAAVLGLDAPKTARDGMALVVEADDGPSGIEVDEVVERCELVVRPLPAPLAGLRAYSGAAVLDDGTIVLVLDPARLPRL
ncbi:MAG TPA: chemotaxis protein CheA [Candidatus Polarisedimenticolaceae bacterium]|nr:chemotaxis protein CheA [Candidatus Polarisedimenticolaceae bacterium]